ncbi:hypothetical protein PZA18_23665, partial [Chitinimonas sp. DQS-5]|nr:hypothetical protein [Parachitinimonas caeni]
MVSSFVINAEYGPHGRVGRLIEEQAVDGVLHRYHYQALSDRLAQREDIAAWYQPDVRSGHIGLQPPPDQPQRPPHGFTADGKPRLVSDYHYDPAGRLVRKTTADGPTRFAYDAAGQLTEAEQAGHRCQLVYDALGRVIREQQGQASLDHHYDALGNRLSSRLPSGRTIQALYYGSGHLHQLSVDGQLISDIERDALHRETHRSQGQLNARFGYDAVGCLIAYAAYGPNSQARLGRRYQYNRAGELLTLHDSLAGPTRYHYDPAGRLLQANDERFN